MIKPEITASNKLSRYPGYCFDFPGEGCELKSAPMIKANPCSGSQCEGLQKLTGPAIDELPNTNNNYR